MLFVLNKKKALILTLVVVFLIFLSGVLKEKLFVTEETFLPSSGKTVIIDAGHGSPDGGAVGESGVLEKDLNLSVAMSLQKFFESGGTQVLLTRSDDNGIYDVSGSIKNKKVSDIKNREEFIKSVNADAFISIHMNKFPEKKYSGPQVFYSGNNEKSKSLAECIQKSMISALNPQSKREIKQADSSIYLLKHTEIPAVLVECGFLSNPEEENKLKDKNYQRQLAWSVYCGIVEYFNEK